jgi:hypothetical protein
MPKSFLQCKVSHKINSTNAKTEEEIIINSSSSYKIDFQIGDIYRGTGENKDKWY